MRRQQVHHERVLLQTGRSSHQPGECTAQSWLNTTTTTGGGGRGVCRAATTRVKGAAAW